MDQVRPPEDLVEVNVLTAKYPNVHKTTFRAMAKRREIYYEPGENGHFRYSQTDADERMKLFRANDPGSIFFEDGRKWIWIKLLSSEPLKSTYPLSVEMLPIWDNPKGDGCIVLKDAKKPGNERPGLKVIYLQNPLRQRTYVPEDFLIRYDNAKKKASRHAERIRRGIGNMVKLEDAIEMGFTPGFLRRHSIYITSARREQKCRVSRKRRSEEPAAHPGLKRLVKTGVWFNGISFLPWFWKPDLEEILSFEPDPEFWVAASDLKTFGVRETRLHEYLTTPNTRLDGKCLKREQFATRPQKHKRTLAWFYWRPHIEKLAEELPTVYNFVYRDANKVDYVTLRRGAQLAGVPIQDLYHWLDRANPKWGDIIPHSLRGVKQKLAHSNSDEPLLVHQQDCINICRYLKGLPISSNGELAGLHSKVDALKTVAIETNSTAVRIEKKIHEAKSAADAEGGPFTDPLPWRIIAERLQVDEKTATRRLKAAKVSPPRARGIVIDLSKVNAGDRATLQALVRKRTLTDTNGH